MPTTVDEKMMYHFVATGNKKVDPNWYSSLLLTEKDTERPGEELEECATRPGE